MVERVCFENISALPTVYLLQKSYAVTGKLKGFDQLLNLVLDDVEEELQGVSLSSNSPNKSHSLTRMHAQSQMLGHAASVSSSYEDQPSHSSTLSKVRQK